MKIEDILTNLEDTCSQNDINIQDVVLLYIMGELTFVDWLEKYQTLQQQVDEFRLSLEEEHDLLWDLQPTIEEDEEHAFAVQHARDIYNILVGRDLC
jgi:uncharacterized protein YaaN involved in tellurite resistance